MLVRTVVVFYAFPSFQLIIKVKVCQKWDLDFLFFILKDSTDLQSK